MSEYYLAVDVDALGGRHLLGWKEEGQLKIQEAYRFAHGLENQDGCWIWDTDRLLTFLLEGVDCCRAMGKLPASIGIDIRAERLAFMGEQRKELEALAFKLSEKIGFDCVVSEPVLCDAQDVEAAVPELAEDFVYLISGGFLRERKKTRFRYQKGLAEEALGWRERPEEALRQWERSEEALGRRKQTAGSWSDTLAERCADLLREVERLSGKQYPFVYMIGEAFRSPHLNQQIANCSGKTVYVGPEDGAAICNLAGQMLASEAFWTVDEARECLFASFPTERYVPAPEEQ